MTTTFKDFAPQDLIGKTVLYENGQSYSGRRSRKLLKIVKVTKTGFRVDTMPTNLFDFNGNQKGLDGRMDMATISKCTLLTESEANEILKRSAIAKETRLLREKMAARLEIMTLEQLKQMDSIQ